MPGKTKNVFSCPWGRAGFAAAPPHPPPPPIILFLLLLRLLFLYLFLCHPPLCFSPVSLSISSFFFSVDLICDRSPSPSLSVYVFSSSFPSFCFLGFSSSNTFPSSRLSGGGALSKGVPQRHFGMPAEPLSLALRPHPQTKLQGCDDRETQPSHPPQKIKQATNSPKPPNKTKSATNVCTESTLGPQQSLKGKLPPSCQ